MSDVKNMAQSKTLWGVIVQLLAMFGLSQGWEIGDQGGWVEAITGLIGAGLSVYGRITAVHKIKVAG